MNEQLKGLSTSSMLETTMWPSLTTLAKVCLTLPVGTASVEHSFSQTVNTWLRNLLGEINLSHLVKIAIELLTLSEQTTIILNVWFEDAPFVMRVWNQSIFRTHFLALWGTASTGENWFFVKYAWSPVLNQGVLTLVWPTFFKWWTVALPCSQTLPPLPPKIYKIITKQKKTTFFL